MDNFGETLRAWRKRRGMSLDDLARASGVSKNYIQGFETGRKLNPSLKVVQALASALGVPVSTFTGEQALPVASVADALRELAERCRLLETTSVPLRGTVGEVREHIVEYVEVPAARIKEGSSDVYALEVTHPLEDEGIDAGDIVVLVPEDAVNEGGGLYVVRIQGEQTLRRAWRVGSHVHIRPGLAGTTVFPAEAVRVVGRVVLGGRWRQF